MNVRPLVITNFMKMMTEMFAVHASKIVRLVMGQIVIIVTLVTQVHFWM